MDIYEVYFDEYKKNSTMIKQLLGEKDTKDKFKKCNQLLNENQQCVMF